MTTITIDETRLAEVRARGLAIGKHESPAAGLCAMEAVAYVLGLPHTDRPDDLCPVISVYVRALNDANPRFRAALVARLPTICGGVRDKSLEPARHRVLAEAAIDMVEIVLPIFERDRPGDDRPRAAIEAARRALSEDAKPDETDSFLEADAAYVGGAAAYVARAAAYGARAPYTTYAAARATDTAHAAANMADAGDLKKRIVERAMRALDDALAVSAAHG